MMRKLRNKKGFSLLEILVAITLLSIGLLGMASLTIGIIQGNTSGNRVTTATTLAQDKMEDIKRLGYGGTSAGTVTEDYNSITNYSSYKRVTVTTDGTPSTGMKSVNVTVYWDSDAYSATLQTILAP